MGFDLGALAALFFVALFFDVTAIAIARRGNRSDAPIVFAGIVAMALGFTLAFALAAFAPGSDRCVAACALLAMGALFACIAANNVHALFACRASVEAKYLGCEEVPTGQVTTLRYPVCAYAFQGTSYRGRSVQSIGARMARRMSAAGTWPIYLDPRRPASFIVRRGVSLVALIMAAMSIAGFGAALYVLAFA